MTQMEKYRKYSKAAEREAAEQFAIAKETSEEALRIEKLKIKVLSKRLYEITDVESLDFEETARAIMKAERRSDELSREYGILLARESQLFNEVLERMATEEMT